MLADGDVLEALRVCFDPESRVNVVDLGRVYAVAVSLDETAPGIEPRSHVVVQVLSREHDAESEQQDAMLAAVISNRLLGIRNISRADVELLDSPRWTPDRMTAAGRAEIGKQRGLIQLG